jgi:DNA polymerase III delta subunit
MGDKRSSKPFFISYGGEPFLLDRDLIRAKEWEGRKVTSLVGDGLADVDLVDLCENKYFDEDHVVVLDEANKLKGDKALRAYIEAKDPADASTILVAIVRADKLPDLWAQAGLKGKVVSHPKFKTWDNNNEVVKWLQVEAMRMELGLDKDVPQLMFNMVGDDLYRLYSELQKLVLLVGKGNKATTKHLGLTLAPSQVVEPYQVAEAAADKDIRKAMNLLSVCYRVMGDEAHVPIAASLARQVERLAVARSLTDRGVGEADVAATLEIHPYRYKVAVLPLVRKHTLSSLVSHMSRLRKLDADVKGPSRSKRTLVELAVLSLAG